MSDFAHNETDKMLQKTEKRVAKVYRDTIKETQAKLKKILDEFADEDERLQKLVASGAMPHGDYIAWREETILRSKHYSDMIATLTQDMVNADKIAMSVVNHSLPSVYALNANYAAYQIEKQTNMNLSWTLYDADTVEMLMRDNPQILPMPSVDIPKDEQWNRKHINGAVTRGILRGDSIPDIAKALQSVGIKDYNVAVRAARTATTAAENSGRIASYERATKMGIDMQQEWLATLDKRTRHEHRLLDGQRVEVGKKFKVNGDEIAFPGDPEAPGYLIYNCRCTLVAAIKGHDQSDAPRDSRLSDMTYDEWQHEKEQSTKVGIQFFAQKSSDYKSPNIPQNVHSHLMHEIVTHASDEDKEQDVFIKYIGKYKLTVENIGVGEYRIISIKKNVTRKWWKK